MARRAAVPAALLALAAALGPPPPAVAQVTTGETRINWCKWDNAPVSELLPAYLQMSADLDALESAMRVLPLLKAMLDADVAEATRHGDPVPAELQRALVQFQQITALYQDRKQIVDCLKRKIEEALARDRRPRNEGGGRFGPRLLALKARADALARQVAGAGPLYDTISIAPAGGGRFVVSDGRRRVVLVPEPGGRTYRAMRAGGNEGGDGPGAGTVTLDLGAEYRMRFAPSFSVGTANAGGALHRFDADSRLWMPTVALRWTPVRDLAFGLTVAGGVTRHGRGSDGTGPGRITSLDGLNTQNIAQSRDAHLELDCGALEVRAFAERRWAIDNPTTWISVGGGFKFARESCRYDFSQFVSGGGAFFHHGVTSRLSNDFYGGEFTLRIDRALGDGWRLGGHVVVSPGVYVGRLSGTQHPGTFGPGTLTVESRLTSAAVAFGGGLGLAWRRGPLGLGLVGEARHETGVPFLTQLPLAGQLFRAQRGSRTTASLMILITVQIVE
jgi:hypothetical protein